MKYCSNCGTEIIFETNFCHNCKMPLKENLQVKLDNSRTFGIWSIILGLIPLCGWVIGGIGLKKAKEFNNREARKLNMIGIIIASISFLFNLYLVSNGYV